jgi:putative oxidoreductase
MTTEDIGKLILRLTLGFLLLFHGMDKLMHGIGYIQTLVAAHHVPAVLAYAVYLGEVIGPLLVITGWYCRIGAALIVVNMLTALFLVHAQDLLALGEHGGWRLELQGFYLFTALATLFLGPGLLRLQRD